MCAEPITKRFRISVTQCVSYDRLYSGDRCVIGSYLIDGIDEDDALVRFHNSVSILYPRDFKIEVTVDEPPPVVWYLPTEQHRLLKRGQIQQLWVSVTHPDLQLHPDKERYPDEWRDVRIEEPIQDNNLTDNPCATRTDVLKKQAVLRVHRDVGVLLNRKVQLFKELEVELERHKEVLRTLIERGHNIEQQSGTILNYYSL